MKVLKRKEKMKVKTSKRKTRRTEYLTDIYGKAIERTRKIQPVSFANQVEILEERHCAGLGRRPRHRRIGRNRVRRANNRSAGRGVILGESCARQEEYSTDNNCDSRWRKQARAIHVRLLG